MSTDTKESGSIKFTAKGYASVLSAMRTAYNERQDFFYEIAMNLYTLCLSDKKKYTKSFFIEGYDSFIDLADYGEAIRYAGCPTHPRYFAEADTIYFILNEIFRNNKGKGTALKPRKSRFVKLTNKDHSIKINISFGSISLSKEHKTLYWLVEENNRSVEAARSHCMSGIMFRTLMKHQWARGEGGAFYYSDEHTESSYASSKFGNQK